MKVRKDGRYVMDKVITDTKTGKKKRKRFYSYDPDEVVIRAGDYLKKIKAGDITSPTTLTVAGYLESWLESHKKKISEQTYNGYRNYIINHISEDELGDILLVETKPMHIENFYNNELDKKLKGKTILQEHRIMHRAFKQAVRNELISRNPIDLVDHPRVDEFQIKIYDEDKFNNLLENIPGTRFEIPVLLAGMCGLRRSEVFGLHWKDVNLDTMEISIQQVAMYSKIEKAWIIKDRPKNQTSRRTFKIPSEIIPVLKKRQGIGLVCHEKGGEIVDGSTFSHDFAELLKDKGLQHIRFHDLRHFNATMMLKYGLSDKEAAARLGHSSPNTLRKTYQHILDSMDKQNAEKLNSIIRKNM